MVLLICVIKIYSFIYVRFGLVSFRLSYGNVSMIRNFILKMIHSTLKL